MRQTRFPLAAKPFQQRILVLVRDKAPRKKCSQFLELIGSVAVAVPADYTRYNQPCTHMEMAGEIVKRGSAARYPSPGTAGPASQPCDGAIPAHGPDGFSPQDFVALQIFCCRAVISAPWAHDLPGRFPARDLRPAARPRPRR